MDKDEALGLTKKICLGTLKAVWFVIKGVFKALWWILKNFKVKTTSLN